jgi:hypothetical protein
MEIRTREDIERMKHENNTHGEHEEGERLEFKSEWPTGENIQHTICAFANAAGGMILIGVDYDNASRRIQGYQGIPVTAGLKERAVDIGGNISPRVIPHSELINVGNDRVVQVIEVKRSQMIPHMANNKRYYMRIDSQNLPMPEAIVEKLYLARYAQKEKAAKILEGNRFFLEQRERPWLSICFCPLYLEDNLISHSKDNLDFLNSLRDIIDRGEYWFRSFIFGYNLFIPDRARISPELTKFVFRIYHHGLFVFGKLIEDDHIYWRSINNWLERASKIYIKLFSKFSCPGFTRISLALNRMNNEKIYFDDRFMDGQAIPQKEAELVFVQDFEDTEISSSMGNIVDAFKTKILAAHGLDEYIS